MSGKLLVFEGIDGAGKTSVAKRLVERLEDTGHPTIYCKAPGQTGIGKILRNLVVEQGDMWIGEQRHAIHYGDPYTAELIHVADLLETATQIILPALERGVNVVMDRFYHSTLAYAIGGLQLDSWVIEDLVDWLKERIDLVVPRMRVFLFDLPVSVAQARLAGGKDPLDRHEPEYYERIQEHYHLLSQDLGTWWHEVDADQDTDAVFAEVLDLTLEVLAA